MVGLNYPLNFGIWYFNLIYFQESKILTPYEAPTEDESIERIDHQQSVHLNSPSF